MARLAAKGLRRCTFAAMYSKQAATAMKAGFWTALGAYMKPIPSAWHPKVNWLNYKTGMKDVFFRMMADNKMVGIGIELRHSDALIRQIFFDHFMAMRGMLHQALEEEWTWVPQLTDAFGKPFARIYTELQGVNIMQEAHWPAMIAFLKPRLIALDAFWADAKDSMEGW